MTVTIRTSKRSRGDFLGLLLEYGAPPRGRGSQRTLAGGQHPAEPVGAFFFVDYGLVGVLHAFSGEGYECVYTTTYIHVYIHTHVCKYVRQNMYRYVCMYACMYACMHVRMYACMHECMYACMYVYTHVFLYMVAVRNINHVSCQSSKSLRQDQVCSSRFLIAPCCYTLVMGPFDSGGACSMGP